MARSSLACVVSDLRDSRIVRATWGMSEGVSASTPLPSEAVQERTHISAIGRPTIGVSVSMMAAYMLVANSDLLDGSARLVHVEGDERGDAHQRVAERLEQV